MDVDRPCFLRGRGWPCLEIETKRNLCKIIIKNNLSIKKKWEGMGWILDHIKTINIFFNNDMNLTWPPRTPAGRTDRRSPSLAWSTLIHSPGTASSKNRTRFSEHNPQSYSVQITFFLLCTVNKYLKVIHICTRVYAIAHGSMNYALQHTWSG